MIPWLTLAIALPAIGAAVIWALPRIKTPAGGAAAADVSAAAAASGQAGAGTATATKARPATGSASGDPALTAKRLALGFSLATLVLVAVMALNFDTSRAGACSSRRSTRGSRTSGSITRSGSTASRSSSS